MQNVEKPATWRDVEKFIKEHKLNQDEYFMLDMATSVNEPVWSPQTRCIAVWLSEGTNEGFYVYVDAITLPPSVSGRMEQRTSKAGGKFWSIEAGMRAVNLLTRYIHGWELYPSILQANDAVALGLMPADEVINPMAVDVPMPKSVNGKMEAPAFVIMMGLATFSAKDEAEAEAIEKKLITERGAINKVRFSKRIKRFTWRQVTERDFENPIKVY